MSQGVPIVTQKTSSSTLSIPTCVPPFPRSKYGTSSPLSTTRYTSPKVEAYNSCVTDETNTYSAILTVYYYDVIEYEQHVEAGELINGNGARDISSTDGDIGSSGGSSNCNGREREHEDMYRMITTVAEVHVQLSHLSLPFDEPSTQVAHIPLMATRDSASSPKEEEIHQQKAKTSPSVVFAKGNTHLYCILPKPSRSSSTGSTPQQSSSAVLLYKLSSPKNTISAKKAAHKPPPRLALPSYILAPATTTTTETCSNTIHLPHIYQPRVLTATMAMSMDLQGNDNIMGIDIDEAARLLSHIIHLVPFTDTLMLAACLEGQMLLLTCQGKILGMLDSVYCRNQQTMDEHTQTFNQGTGMMGGVRTMSVSWNKENGGEEDNEGRLVVVCRDGSVKLFGVKLGPLVREVEKQDSEDDGWTQLLHTSNDYSNGYSNGQSDGYYNCYSNGHSNGLFKGHRGHQDEKKTDLTGETNEEKTFKIIQSQSHNLRFQISHLGDLPTMYDMCHAIFVGYPKVALLVDPLSCNKRQNIDADEDCRAQIWHVGLDESKESSCAILMSELKIGANSSSGLPHDTFGKEHSADVQVDYQAFEPNMLWDGPAVDRFSLQRGISATSLVVNSAVCIKGFKSVASSKLQPFALIWDWNKCWTGYSLINAQMQVIPKLGETGQSLELRGGCLSFVCIAHDSIGFRFVHMTNCTGEKICKDIFSLGILSPSSCRSTSTQIESCLLQQPNPIFCTRNYVSYPHCLDPSVQKDVTVQWKQNKIPSNYSINGAIQCASIGRNFGRSIAVANSRGVCVLDLTKGKKVVKKIGDDNNEDCLMGSDLPNSCMNGVRSDLGSSAKWRSNQSKWKMLSEVEERQFSVQAMTWWERNGTDGSSEDLLFSAIKYESNLGENQIYLVCWSRRRLGLGKYQLLEKTGDETDIDDQKAGIKLPSGFVPTSISFIAEPHSSSTKMHRGILLLTSELNGTTTFVLYQLQAMPMNDNNTRRLAGEPDCRVLAHLASKETFDTDRNFLGSSLSHASIFIAGASFNFNFEQDDAHSTKCLNVATLGIVHENGHALSAVIVGSKGLLAFANIFHAPKSSYNPKQIRERIKYFTLGDVNNNIMEKKGNFVWTFERTNGHTLSWLVPFFSTNTGDLAGHDHDGCRTPVRIENFQSISFLTGRSSTNPNAPEAPTRVRDSEFSLLSILGTVCDNGDCMHACATDNTNVFLGQLPSQYTNSTLYAGQMCRNITTEHSPFKSSKKDALHLYGLTDCVIGPPSFTTSLLTSLAVDGTKHQIDVIKKSKHFDSTFVALKTIVTFLIECIYSSQQKIASGQENIDDETLSIFTAQMLTKVIEIASQGLDSVQFSFLFLSIGRQLEPHHCNHLFPILDSSHTQTYQSLSPEFEGSSAEDAPLSLYLEAVHAGSLSIASSALPLLSQKRLTHQRCIKLLHHCITQIFQSCDCKNRRTISFFSQECILMQPLLQYAMKIEESFLHCSMYDDLSDSERSVDGDDIRSSNDCDTSYESEEDNYHVKDHTSSDETFSMISSFFSPSRLFYSSAKKEIEIAISEAAVSFVASGYDTNNLGKHEAQHPENDDIEVSGNYNEFIVENLDDANLNSATDIIAKAFISQFVSSVLEIGGKGASHLPGLDNIAVISMVLRPALSSEKVSIEEVKKVINGITKNHLVTCFWGTMTFPSVENSLATLLRSCLKQWNQESACAIFDVVLRLLSRKTSSQENSDVSLLVLLIVYAGKCCGKMQLILPHDKEGNEGIFLLI